VPEDSVRPETQTLVILIRRKGFVGSFENLIFLLAKIFNKKVIKTLILMLKILNQLKLESKRRKNNT